MSGQNIPQLFALKVSTTLGQSVHGIIYQALVEHHPKTHEMLGNLRIEYKIIPRGWDCRDSGNIRVHL